MTKEKSEVIPSEVPVINYTLCTHCNQCVEVCLKNVIQSSETFTCSKCVKYCITMEVPCSPEHYVFNYRDCDACGLCFENCPAEALYWHKINEKG
jgi:formate hydrogenlyase subunit 6/NADH:ubiquinone oxidoreductase subunit I